MRPASEVPWLNSISVRQSRRCNCIIRLQMNKNKNTIRRLQMHQQFNNLMKKSSHLSAFPAPWSSLEVKRGNIARLVLSGAKSHRVSWCRRCTIVCRAMSTSMKSTLMSQSAPSVPSRIIRVRIQHSYCVNSIMIARNWTRVNRTLP